MHITYAHPPTYFKSYLGYLQYLIQFKCTVNSCQCATNSYFASWNVLELKKYFSSMVDWIYKCGIQLYIITLLLKNFHTTSTPAVCSNYIYSQNKSPTNLIGFPSGSVVKNPPANAGDVGLISGLGWSSGGGNGSPLQYSCLENPMGRGACLATVHGVPKSCTWLSDWAYKITFCLWICNLGRT